MTNVLNIHSNSSQQILSHLEKLATLPYMLQCASIQIMRKEIFIAIIVGVIVGLGITFGLYTVRQQLFNNRTAQEIENSRQQGAQSDDQPNSNMNLLIQQPDQDLFTQEKDVQVVGKALPESYIVILVGTREYITTADVDGDFAQTIEVDAGGNRVTIVATTQDGAQESVIRNIVYSTVDLNNNSATESATAETEE